MKWWNGIWLNEAFATFMALLAVDGFRPDLGDLGLLRVGREAAKDVDGAGEHASGRVPVTPLRAEGMFDVLTYQKGPASFG